MGFGYDARFHLAIVIYNTGLIPSLISVVFFVDIKLPFAYIQLIPKRVLGIFIRRK